MREETLGLNHLPFSCQLKKNYLQEFQNKLNTNNIKKVKMNCWDLAGSSKHKRTQSSISVQFSSVAQSCLTLCDPMDCSMPGLPVHHQLPELVQTHVHWVGDAIQPSHPLLLPFPPTLNLSQHRGLSNESVLHIRWPKYWNFSFNISPSDEYSGMISFRMDWLDFLAVQGTLKSLL